MNEVEYETSQEMTALGEQVVEMVSQALGCPPDIKTVEHRVYKDTTCGAWVKFETDKLAVTFGSIVEGVDNWEPEPITLVWPFSTNDVEQTLNDIENAVDEIWNATHGCDDCQTDEIDGYKPIQPGCKSCGGFGTVI